VSSVGGWRRHVDLSGVQTEHDSGQCSRISCYSCPCRV